MYTKPLSFLFIFSLLFTSCAKESLSDEAITNQKVEGTWNVYSFDVDNSELMLGLDFSKVRFTNKGDDEGSFQFWGEGSNGDSFNRTNDYTIVGNADKFILNNNDVFLLRFPSEKEIYIGSEDGSTLIKAVFESR